MSPAMFDEDPTTWSRGRVAGVTPPPASPRLREPSQETGKDPCTLGGDGEQSLACQWIGPRVDSSPPGMGLGHFFASFVCSNIHTG